MLPTVRSYSEDYSVDKDKEGHSTDSVSSDDDYDSSGGGFHPYLDHTGQIMETLGEEDYDHSESANDTVHQRYEMRSHLSLRARSDG